MNHLIEMRNFLHSHPEIGFALTETTAFVKNQLEMLGISPRSCGKCGLLADIGRGEKCFLLRADMDALPIGGKAVHACGHDLHTAMLLGAAQLLKAREASLPGRVRLMFQSAEEILAGAADMIANGALENPRPGGGMMIHVLTALEIPAGTVLFPPEGVIAPGAGCFSVDIFGRGCHGSTPEKGISPVRAAANIALALESLVSAEVGLDHPAVVSIGSMQAGEEAANVIPDRARLMGSLRAFDGETLAFLEKRIGEIARGMAEAERCRAEVKLFSQCPPMTNDRVLTDLAREAVDSLGLARQDVPLGGGGSEDFAYVAREIPALLLPLAAGEPSRGFVHPAHHPLTDFDGAVLPMGAKILAWVAEEWLKRA